MFQVYSDLSYDILRQCLAHLKLKHKKIVFTFWNDFVKI